MEDEPIAVCRVWWYIAGAGRLHASSRRFVLPRQLVYDIVAIFDELAFQSC